MILVNEKIQGVKKQTFHPFLCPYDFLMTPGDVLRTPLSQHDVLREDELLIMQQGDSDVLEATTLRRL